MQGLFSILASFHNFLQKWIHDLVFLVYLYAIFLAFIIIGTESLMHGTH